MLVITPMHTPRFLLFVVAVFCGGGCGGTLAPQWFARVPSGADYITVSGSQVIVHGNLTYGEKSRRVTIDAETGSVISSGDASYSVAPSDRLRAAIVDEKIGQGLYASSHEVYSWPTARSGERLQLIQRHPGHRGGNRKPIIDQQSP